jgi:hypothetical protein
VSHYVGFIVESTVAVLLLITVAYCFLLNRRLHRFRADEQAFRTVIGELITATETAERAIAGLKLTVRECDQNLGERLRAAERFSADMDRQIASGETLLRRITEIAAVGRPAPTPAPMPMSNARSALAAAEALIERTRNRTGEIAA